MILKNIESEIDNYRKFFPQGIIALMDPFMKKGVYPKSGDFFIADSINCKWKRDNLKYKFKKNTGGRQVQEVT